VPALTMICYAQHFSEKVDRLHLTLKLSVHACAKRLFRYVPPVK
jgi:hypothetical protein